jgi:hypothetical protein
MNIQQFIFKITVILTYILRMAILLLPIAIVVVISKEDGWRYGFTFIRNNLDVALFVAFAIGFLVAMYHAVSFEIVGKSPNENYLRTCQKVYVKGEMTIDELSKSLIEKKRYKNISVSNGVITGRKLVHLMKPDYLNISKNGNLFTVESRPFTKLWFIDFGRNFKTVKEIAKIIKG